MAKTSVEIDPRVSSLVARLLERRVVPLIRGLREQRADIAERMSATGNVLSSGFLSEVTRAFIVGFESYARDAQQDVFGLLRDSNGMIEPTSSAWAKELLENNFERVAENLCGEVGGGGPLSAELQKSVRQAMTMSVAAVKRDLGIDLDRAALAQTRPAAVDDPTLRDTLVPLQNARGLELRFQAVAGDAGEPLSLVLFDIDLFKQVNDDHGGHATGDEALCSIAEVAAACVKGKGCAYRLHGDEFALLLPNHTLQEGLAVAERLRREVNSSQRTSRALTISVSVGLAVWPTNGADLDALQKAADSALYDAKKRGRNIVRYYGEPELTSLAPREPERKEPDPSSLSPEEMRKIRQDHFRGVGARCPRDEALLEVIDITAMQDRTGRILISCPLCGLSETV